MSFNLISYKDGIIGEDTSSGGHVSIHYIGSSIQEWWDLRWIWCFTCSFPPNPVLYCEDNSFILGILIPFWVTANVVSGDFSYRGKWASESGSYGSESESIQFLSGATCNSVSSQGRTEWKGKVLTQSLYIGTLRESYCPGPSPSSSFALPYSASSLKNSSVILSCPSSDLHQPYLYHRMSCTLPNCCPSWPFHSMPREWSPGPLWL